MQKWLLTGGAGFIGSNLVRYLLEERPHDHVTVLDALTYAGHRISLEGCEKTGRFGFVHGNVCDEGVVESALSEGKPDVVMHLAAESHVDRSIYGPAPFLSTNVQGTFRVLEAVRATGVRLVVVGTDEVYGSLGPTGRFDERSALQPSSPYSASKASADLLALSYHRTYDLDVVVTRCSNNYGPYQMPEKLIPLMIMKALHDEPLPVYGDGMNIRDWIYVKDHCEGLLLAAEKGRPGEVYNLGGETEMANLEVVRRVVRRLGKPESLIRFVTDRPGHDRRYAMDISRARTELGFVPRVEFGRGLDLTVDWYAGNRRWCAAVESESHKQHLKKNYEQREETPAP